MGRGTLTFLILKIKSFESVIQQLNDPIFTLDRFSSPTGSPVRIDQRHNIAQALTANSQT